MPCRTAVRAALLGQTLAVTLAAQGAGGEPRPISVQSEVRFSVPTIPGGDPRHPSRADAVGFDRANRLYVLDRQNRLIYLFGADGALERRIAIGAVAEAPLQMVLTRDDRIVVSDAARKVFVSIDSHDPRQATVHPFRAMALSGPLMAHPDGGVVSQARPIAEGDLAAGRLPLPRLVWFPLDGREEVVLHTFAGTPGPSRARNPLAPAPLAAPLPGGAAVVALPGTYRLRIVGEGRAREIVRAVAPRRVGELDRRWARRQAACAELFSVGPGGRSGPSLSGISAPMGDFPDRMPVIRALGVAPDGRIWVERMPADPDHPGFVDLFAPDGGLLGSVQGIGVPRAWAPDGETAAYVTRDDACRETVQVRRVRTGAPR